MKRTTLLVVAMLSATLLPSSAQADASVPVFTWEAFQSGDIATIDGTDAKNATQAFAVMTNKSRSIHGVSDITNLKAGILTTFTSSFVDLAWAPRDDVEKYIIQRDGEKISETTENSFRDTSFQRDTEHFYQVAAVLKEKELADPTAEPDPNARPDTWGATLDMKGSFVSDEDVQIKADTLNKLSGLESWAGARVQYQTFIPEAKIQIPNVPGFVRCQFSGSDWSYGGNNRTWSSNMMNNSKTYLEGKVGMGPSGPMFVAAGVVLGYTRVYNKSGGLHSQATGDKSKMSVKEVAHDAQGIAMRLQAVANNPYCDPFPAGQISGAFTIRTTTARSFYIASGTHRQMPNHEIYIAYGVGGLFKNIYKRVYVSPACLAGALACPLAPISASGSY